MIEAVTSLIQTAINAAGSWRDHRPTHLKTTVDRFKYLVEQHGFTLPQVPRLLPENLRLPLNAFETDRSIAKALTVELLQWAADTFNVRHEWLEGADTQIYDQKYWTRRNIDRLFQCLEKDGVRSDDTRMNVFATADLTSDSNALVWITLEVSFFPGKPEDDHEKYIPLSDQWAWESPSDQNFLIALAGKFGDWAGLSVPVFVVPQRTLLKMQAGEVIPNHRYLKKCRASGIYLDSYLRPEFDANIKSAKLRSS